MAVKASPSIFASIDPRPDIPGVNFYSPIGVASGLGSAGRGYLAGLRATGIEVAPVPVHELFIHQPGIGNSERYRRPRHPIALVHVNADSIPRFLHFHGRSFDRARYSIALWVWELPAFRDEWWDELRHFGEIWVPSTFCGRAVQAVTAKPVVVVPHAVIVPQAPPGSRSRHREKLRIADDEFLFLYIFDASSAVERKNPRCLIDAFEHAFSDTDRARLVLKVSHAESDPELSRCLDDLARRNPRCRVIRETMQPQELTDLLEACDCYVSPHRSEGFGLTVAEAMALGKPVIATGYGGTADFLTAEVGFPIDYRLVEVGRDYGPYGKSAIWADPCCEHLRELLRTVMANPGEAAIRAERARARMQRDYSAASIGRLMRDRLAAVAARGFMTQPSAGPR